MEQTIVRFADRRDAGQRLSAKLHDKTADNPVILALPRGGVPVAYEVAKALDAWLDLLMVRKIGAPGWPEYGVGAIIDGADPHLVLNEEIVRQIAPSPNYITAEKRRQLAEIKRQRLIYLGERHPIDLTDRTVIIVDDGIATGATMKAALQGVRKNKPRKIILAVPVAARSSLRELEEQCDEIICLHAPAKFDAIGSFYKDFSQTEDSEVISLMAKMK